jgi:hypothetical protein
MEEGFLLDYCATAKIVASWVAGAPEFGWTGSLQLREHEQLYVQVFRCTNCGFLESYAPRLS